MKTTRTAREAAPLIGRPSFQNPLSFPGIRFMSAGGDGGQNPAGGDSGESGTGGDEQGGQNGTSNAPDPSNDGGKTGDEQGTQTPEPTELSEFPEAAQAMIRELRRENGNYRTAKKAAEETAATAGDEAKQSLIQDLGKALGLIDDGDQGNDAPTTEDLTRQISETQDAHRATRVELAVYRNASEHEADPDALLDSRSFLQEVADLDPDDREFSSKIGSAIKAAAEKNPKLKLAGQAPGRSGGQVNGGGSTVEETPGSLASRIRKARNY